MFSKETYISRRQELKRLVGEGVIILFGNNEAPANYPANSYAPMSTLPLHPVNPDNACPLRITAAAGT